MATVLAVGAGVQFFAMATTMDVIVEQPSSGGSLRASLKVPKFVVLFDNPDGLVVQVERPGVVVTDLDTLCISGTSGPPSRARIRWQDSHSFTVITSTGYGYGPWKFRVDGDQVRSDDPAWKRC